MIRVTPISIRKVPSVVDGCACPGAAVWAKDSVVWIEMISPAVDSDDRNSLRIVPIISPISSSLITAPATPDTVPGTGRP